MPKPDPAVRRVSRDNAFLSAPLELYPPTRPPTFQARWLPLIVIFIATILAYIPSLKNEFVSWDDDHYVYKNHQVHYDDGIKSIWFDVYKHKDPKFKPEGKEDRVSHQYYPMVFTLYWIEFRFHKWINHADPRKTIQENIDSGKMTATSFHAVSLVLHAFNTVLVVLALRKLGFTNWTACAASALFALHPMQVASVAWVAERKNIISLMFYLLAMMAYVSMRRFGAQAAKEQRGDAWIGSAWRYILMLVLFQAGLFSKTATLTLPVTLFLTDRLLERRWDLRSMAYSALRIAPMLIMAAIAANTTMNVEDRQRTIPITEAQRPLLPATSLLFYVWKMLVPVDQSPVYPLWNPQPNLLWTMPIFIVGILAALMIIFRRKLGPHFIWAILFYVVIQFPMLGFKNINFFQFAFVADHYFYHGSVGLFAAAAMGIEALGRRFRDPRQGFQFATGLTAAFALALGARTMTYAKVWHDSETFWKRTLALNDGCWAAWYNTANARRGWAEPKLEKATSLEATARGYEKSATAKDAEAQKIAGADASTPESEALRAEAEALRAKAPPLREEAKKLRAEANVFLDDAVARYQKVAEIHKGISQPFEQWLAVRKQQARYSDAADAAEAAIRRFPHLLRFYDAAADLALAAKQYDRAERDATQGITAATTRKDAYYVATCREWLATAYAATNRLDQAVPLAEQSLPVIIARGDYLMQNGQPCAAKVQFQRAMLAFQRAPNLANHEKLRDLYKATKKKRADALSKCPDTRDGSDVDAEVAGG